MSMPTSKRRISAAVMSAGVIAGLLVGCSTNTNGSQSADTLTVGVNGGAAMKTVIEKFENDNPGVTVKIQDSPDSYQQVTATQLTGGTAPDVIQVFPGTGNNVSVKIAGSKGFFADLSNEEWVNRLPERAKDLLTTPGGQVVAVPMTFSSIGAIYNSAAVAEAGLTVPEKWSDVLSFCSDAKAKGKVAFGLGLSDTWTTQLIPYALTASLVYSKDPEFAKHQAEGETTFSASAWREAFNKYLAMNEAGCFNPSPNGSAYAQVQEAIVKGTTLATVSVAAETSSIAGMGTKELKLDYRAFPATDDPSETYLSATVGPSFAVNAKSSKAELAKRFVAYLSDPETQVTYASAYGDTAAMPGDKTQDSQVAKLVTQYVSEDKISTWPDQLWPSTTIQPAMFDGVQALFSGQDNVDGVLQKMDSAFKQGAK